MKQLQRVCILAVDVLNGNFQTKKSGVDKLSAKNRKKIDTVAPGLEFYNIHKTMRLTRVATEVINPPTAFQKGEAVLSAAFKWFEICDDDQSLYSPWG